MFNHLTILQAIILSSFGFGPHKCGIHCGWGVELMQKSSSFYEFVQRDAKHAGDGTSTASETPVDKVHRLH